MALSELEPSAVQPRRPRRTLLVALPVSVLLALGWLLPWVRVASPERFQANVLAIETRIETVRAADGVSDVLLSLDLVGDGPFNLEAAMFQAGWGGVWQALEAGHAWAGLSLLARPEPAMLVRLLAGVQALLTLGTAAWYGLTALSRTGRWLAVALAGLSLFATVLLVASLPVLDTLGWRDDFALSFAMAVAEARPASGLWLCFCGDTAAFAFFAFQGALGATAGRTRSPFEASVDEWLVQDA